MKAKRFQAALNYDSLLMAIKIQMRPPCHLNAHVLRLVARKDKKDTAINSAGAFMPNNFTPGELAVLRAVQFSLPDSLTPYADIAIETGMDETEIIALLTRLKNEGVIRRFGASIKHQKTGWTHNVMVAWRADEASADAAGEAVAKHPNISHCYYRPSSTPDWPYTFFTMIHGRSAEECHEVIETLRREKMLDEYAALESLKELKKTSMTYF